MPSFIYEGWFILAANLVLASFVLPGAVKANSRVRMLVTFFIAHLVFQMPDTGSGSIYRDYFYVFVVDILFYILCFLCNRKLLTYVGFLSLATVGYNLFGVSYYIMYNDGVITSIEMVSFLNMAEPVILCITFMQTLLLAYDTYGRDSIKRLALYLDDRPNALLRHKMVSPGNTEV